VRILNNNQPVHDILAPYIGAIDGLDQSSIIKQGYRPWMAQSPLMAYQAVLSSSCWQASHKGYDVSKHTESIAIKVEIISIMNEYLKANRGVVSDEVISAVNHFLVNEVRIAHSIWF
jgi:hypothetical protein